MLWDEGLDYFRFILGNALAVLEPYPEPAVVDRTPFSLVDLPAGLPQRWFGTHGQMVVDRPVQPARRCLLTAEPSEAQRQLSEA